METNMYELLYMIRMGDEWSLQELFYQCYELQQNQIKKLIMHYKPLNIYLDDLYQEGRIALNQAIETYREDQFAIFSTYVYLLTKRRIWTILRHYATESYVHMHDALNLECFVREQDCIYDILPQPHAMNEPEYYLNYKMAKERLEDALTHLTQAEQELLQLWMSNLNYEKASQRLGITYKAYDGRLQRVRKKIKDAVYCT